MKKVKKFLMTLLPSFFVLGMCLPAVLNNSPKKDNPGLDTAVYDHNLSHARLDRPDIKRLGDDDDDEEEVIEVDKVVLHYYNEAGGNAGRAFYLWCTGEDGVEYNLDNAKDIMSVSDDGTMMTIQVDFADARFKAFAGKSSMFFIIKYKNKESTKPIDLPLAPDTGSTKRIAPVKITPKNVSIMMRYGCIFLVRITIHLD